MMKITDFHIKVSDKEYEILDDLYTYRVMTTDQIKKKHFNNQGTYVNKVLWNMRNKNLIKTQVLNNSRKGKRGYSYHRLTETGLSCLGKHDNFVEGQSSLYVKPKQVPYLLMVSELVSELANTEWEIWDSRKVKKEYNLDSRMNIQGLALSPERKRYGLYILQGNTLLQTIGKIQSEIKMNANNLLHDYLVISMGRQSLLNFIDRAIDPNIGNNENKNELYTGHSIKVYPYVPFVQKAKTFQTEKEWIETLCNYYGFGIKSMEIKETRQSFPIIVEYQEKEWYLVDLTDSDLKKYRDIEVYSKSNSSQRWEQRNIIVITLKMPTKINIKLKDMPSVKLMALDGKDYMNLCMSNH